MNDETFLNERVQVVAVFKNGSSQHGNNSCFPVKFKRLNGQEVTISELGLRHPVSNGSKTIHVFDVTDGSADYRLEFDSQHLTWRLTLEADHYE